MTVGTSSTAMAIEEIQERLAPLRAQLAAHPIYGEIQNIAQLRIFMESHVFAVWDFMSLLKSLQRALTCVDIPWAPTAFPAGRRFINEIVLGEESDLYEGRPVSHFEIYLESMERAGASTAPIRRLLQNVRQGQGGKLDLRDLPAAARSFVEHTFNTIHSGSLAASASAFTFGREDVIPRMFRSLVRDLNHQMDGDLSQFVWYLERHIEVDGDEHGPLALRLVAEMCGKDPALWEQAADAATQSMQARLALWDGILAQIKQAEAVSV